MLKSQIRQKSSAAVHTADGEQRSFTREIQFWDHSTSEIADLGADCLIIQCIAPLFYTQAEWEALEEVAAGKLL